MKITAPQHQVNESVANGFIDLIKKEIGTEVAVFEQMIGFMFTGALSVRGAKATLEKVKKEAGNLPSIPVTASQYLISAWTLRLLEGGATHPLKDVVSVAIQGERRMGKKEFLAYLAKRETYLQAEKMVSLLPKKVTARSAKGVEGCLKALAEALELDNSATIENIELAEDVAKQLTARAKIAKQLNHPAGKALSA